MEKFPFTSEGAAALVAALYALPDVQLQQEADAVAANFSKWLASRFDLEASQEVFLGGMSPTLLSFMGSQVSFAFRHRLPVTLVKPERNQAVARDSKLIETKTKIDASGDGGGNDSANGEVIISVNY